MVRKAVTLVDVQRWEKSGLKEGQVYRFRMYNQHGVLIHEVITDNPSPQDARLMIEKQKPGAPIKRTEKDTIDYPVRLGYDA